MGFLDEADVDVNDIPDDPFGFGKEFWPIYITEIKDPEVTKSGERFGMMISWAVDHPKYVGTQVATKLGNGNWFQLPVPKVLQDQVPWDPKGKDVGVLVNLKNLLLALGFGVDEMSGVGPAKMVGRRCLAKIKAEMGDMGFWQFNLQAFKPEGENSGNGLSEFANPGKSPEDLLKEEMNSI